MSEEVPAAPQPTAIEREIAAAERWGDWDRVEGLKQKLDRTLTKKRKDERKTEMSEEQNRLDELLQEKDDLDSAITEARLLVTDDEETPAPEAESVVTETPATQTALLAEIGKLEAAGKFKEAGPLKAQLVATQSGFGGLSPQTPAPAPELPTLDALTKQIDEAEAAGNYSASSALKSQVLQRQFVGGH